MTPESKWIPAYLRPIEKSDLYERVKANVTIPDDMNCLNTEKRIEEETQAFVAQDPQDSDLITKNA